jgi:hypothetical protein
MGIRAPLILFAYCVSFLHAEVSREFHSSAGVARMTLILGPEADSSAGLRQFKTAFSDTLSDIPALFCRGRSRNLLVELAYTERGTGQELRFPLRYAQVRDCAQHNAEAYATGSMDERAVALVRDLARNLHVRMKDRPSGGGK